MGAKYGDIVYVNRTPKYKHFGIYSGNDKVIHYTKTKLLNGVIDETSLSEFLEDSTEYYSVDLTIHSGKLKRYSHRHDSQSKADSIPKFLTPHAPLGFFSFNFEFFTFEYWLLILSSLGLSVSCIRFLYEHFIKEPHLYSPEDTVHRAYSHIGDNDYNLITHNCEHFAIYCKTGIYDSKQVQNIIECLLVPGLFAVVKHTR